jgi:hypothetical protein
MHQSQVATLHCLVQCGIVRLQCGIVSLQRSKVSNNGLLQSCNDQQVNSYALIVGLQRTIASLPLSIVSLQGSVAGNQ